MAKQSKTKKVNENPKNNRKSISPLKEKTNISIKLTSMKSRSHSPIPKIH
jgi:hypothetical protein